MRKILYLIIPLTTMFITIIGCEKEEFEDSLLCGEWSTYSKEAGSDYQTTYVFKKNGTLSVKSNLSTGYGSFFPPGLYKLQIEPDEDSGYLEAGHFPVNGKIYGYWIWNDEKNQRILGIYYTNEHTFLMTTFKKIK